jgi:hypothetical protein
MIIASSCTTATDESGAPSTDEAVLDSSFYPSSMATICEATSTKLAALPIPPEQISRADWATEVSRIFAAEAAAFENVQVSDTIRVDHRTLIATATEQAAQWTALGAALADDTATDAIGDIGTEITALTLGRNDLVDSMGLPACEAPGAES